MMKTKIALLFILFMILPVVSHAQCAMCRAVLQNQGGGGAAAAINDGITYLMIFPYLLVGGVAFCIWRLLRVGKKHQ